MRIAIVLLAAFGALSGLAPGAPAQSTQRLPPKLTGASAACLECHAARKKAAEEFRKRHAL